MVFCPNKTELVACAIRNRVVDSTLGKLTGESRDAQRRRARREGNRMQRGCDSESEVVTDLEFRYEARTAVETFMTKIVQLRRDLGISRYIIGARTCKFSTIHKISRYHSRTSSLHRTNCALILYISLLPSCNLVVGCKRRSPHNVLHGQSPADQKQSQARRVVSQEKEGR